MADTLAELGIGPGDRVATVSAERTAGDRQLSGGVDCGNRRAAESRLSPGRIRLFSGRHGAKSCCASPMARRTRAKPPKEKVPSIRSKWTPAGSCASPARPKGKIRRRPIAERYRAGPAHQRQHGHGRSACPFVTATWRRRRRTSSTTTTLTPTTSRCARCRCSTCTGWSRPRISTLLSGGTVVVPAKFNPLSFWRTVRDYRVTWYSAVPTIHHLLLAARRRRTAGRAPKACASSAPAARRCLRK